MKRNLSIALLFLAAAGFAAAQPSTPTTDVLGAHLNYGRGCAACHAPHSGVYGNGNAGKADPTSGNIALWGEDVRQPVRQNHHHRPKRTRQLCLNFCPTSTNCRDSGRSWRAHVPQLPRRQLCAGAMMKNKVYETLPSTYGTKNTIPTLLGNDGGTVGNYLNDHPVGTQRRHRLRRHV